MAAPAVTLGVVSKKPFEEEYPFPHQPVTTSQPTFRNFGRITVN
jgi:hypothetical protein